jgi:hypothetical protein
MHKDDCVQGEGREGAARVRSLAFPGEGGRGRMLPGPRAQADALHKVWGSRPRLPSPSLPGRSPAVRWGCLFRAIPLAAVGDVCIDSMQC